MNTADWITIAAAGASFIGALAAAVVSIIKALQAQRSALALKQHLTEVKNGQAKE